MIRMIIMRTMISKPKLRVQVDGKEYERVFIIIANHSIMEIMVPDIKLRENVLNHSQSFNQVNHSSRPNEAS
jgi:hypothetical protein